MDNRSKAGTPFEITDSTISAYQAVVLERFDAAPTSSEKMRVIAREYYFALWGNGYEAYNLMRRTGFPDRDDNLQPALTLAHKLATIGSLSCIHGQ